MRNAKPVFVVLVLVVVVALVAKAYLADGADEGGAPLAPDTPALTGGDVAELAPSRNTPSDLALPDSGDDAPRERIGEPPVEVTPARVASSNDVVERIPDLAQATFFGGMEADLFLELALDALACLGERPADRVVNDTCIYEVATPTGGTFTVAVPLEARSDRHDLTLSSELATNPGWVTGCPDDGAERASVELHVKLDGGSGAPNFASLARSHWQTSLELKEYIDSMGRPVPSDGVFESGAEGATWSQVLLEPITDDDGGFGWYSSLGDPQAVDVTFDDARVAQVAAGLEGLRRVNRSVLEDG